MSFTTFVETLSSTYAGTSHGVSPLLCISTAIFTAWHTASEEMEPIVNTPLSIASGRSVEVRTLTAGNLK